MTSIFTLEKLFAAYKQCQKGKKNTLNALKFELDREKNLMKLLQELQTRCYEVSRHICFVIIHPSAREIFAADFRDRIVHHLLCNEIQDIFEADFIPRSYANRKGKGTHEAVRQLREDFQHMKSRTGGGYYLKLDIESFFRSINKTVLYSIVEKRIKAFQEKTGGGGGEKLSQKIDLAQWRDEVLWLAKKIIFHDPTKNYFYKGDPRRKLLIPKHKSLFYTTGGGMPIGNLTSQFFANVYLNELDQFAVKILGIERYVRYVDDFVIVDDSVCRLRSLILTIDTFLKEKLLLKIHRGKIQLQEIRKGIDFLGYFVRSTHVLVRQKVVRRCKYKIRDIEPDMDAEDVLPVLNSYYGHFHHANSFSLRKHLYDSHMEKMKKNLETDEAYRSLWLRKK